MTDSDDSNVVMPDEPSSNEGREINARPVRFAQLPDSSGSKREGHLSLLEGVTARVSVELGRSTMPIKQVLALAPGSVVELDRLSTEPIDILVNGELVARGEVVVLDNEFGVRVTEIVKPYPG